VSCAKYPTAGTRSVYFPQRSMNKKPALLGYAGPGTPMHRRATVRNADCIKNISEIAAIPAWTFSSWAQNDLCMSMGLYEKI